MRPIPQTIEVLTQLSRSTGVQGLQSDLQSMADRVQELVPDCVGLSLAWVSDGLTFTLVASDQQLAVLDALQYLDGGPCVKSVELGYGLETSRETLFAEDQWRLFAQGTAAYGVRCSVTFPLVIDHHAVGSVNLYGASDRAFEGHLDALAEILGAWAPGAVSNADLSFDSRRQAELAPQQLQAQDVLARATGVIAAHYDIDIDIAHDRLLLAADRARIGPEELARAILALGVPEPGDEGHSA
jgi:transcriptional regulator with GAF, ATPase, and Fis domain